MRKYHVATSADFVLVATRQTNIMQKRHGGFGSTPDFVFPAFILLLGAVGVFPAYMKWYDGVWPWFAMIGAFFILPCAFFGLIAVSFWLEEWNWKRRKKREERRQTDRD